MPKYYVFTKENRVFNEEDLKKQSIFKVEDSKIFEPGIKVGDQMSVKEFHNKMVASFQKAYPELGINHFWEICSFDENYEHTFPLTNEDYLKIETLSISGPSNINQHKEIVIIKSIGLI